MGQTEILEFLERNKGEWFNSNQLKEKLKLPVGRSLKKLFDFKRIIKKKVVDKGYKIYYSYNENWRNDQVAAKNPKRPHESNPDIINKDLNSIVVNRNNGFNRKVKVNYYSFRVDDYTLKALNDLKDRNINLSKLMRDFVVNYRDSLL